MTVLTLPAFGGSGCLLGPLGAIHTPYPSPPALHSFGHQHVSPRGLLASYLRTLVCVEGIVTKCTSVRPKLVKSVHFNPSNQSFTSREYRDSTAVELGLDAGGR